MHVAIYEFRSKHLEITIKHWNSKRLTLNIKVRDVDDLAIVLRPWTSCRIAINLTPKMTFLNSVILELLQYGWNSNSLTLKMVKVMNDFTAVDGTLSTYKCLPKVTFICSTIWDYKDWNADSLTLKTKVTVKDDFSCVWWHNFPCWNLNACQ